jgi:hypothetical protein
MSFFKRVFWFHGPPQTQFFFGPPGGQGENMNLLKETKVLTRHSFKSGDLKHFKGVGGP